MDISNKDMFKLVEPEAAIWVWSNLWSKDAVHHVSLDILDVMWYTAPDEIGGMLFTATDKTVKSRLRQKWNLKEFAAKCVLPRAEEHRQMVAHVRTNDDWRVANKVSILNSIARKAQFIVAIGGKLGPSAYTNGTLIEQQLDMGDSIAPPKVTTYRLTEKSPVLVQQGHKLAYPEDGVQLELNRVMSRDKRMNDKVRKASHALIKVLENRRFIKISRIRLIFALTRIDGEEGTREEERVWLHHVAEIDYSSKVNNAMYGKSVDQLSELSSGSLLARTGAIPSVLGGKSMRSLSGSNVGGMDFDRKSMTTSIVQSDRSTRGQTKHCKCAGDFCSYLEREEVTHMNNNVDFDIHLEGKKAKQRHRQLADSENTESLNDALRSSNIDQNNESEFRPGTVNQDGEVIEQSSVQASDIDELMRGNEDEDGDGFGSSAAPGTVIGGRQRFISAARKVPKKSISLARHDMTELEALEAQATAILPCMGVAKGGTTEDNINNSANYENSGRYIATHQWSELLQHWWWRMGRSVVLRRGNQKDKPLSSADAIQEAIFNDNSHNVTYADRNVDGSPKKPRGKYEENTASREMGNKASENKLGHLSTYYSEAVVCERCYIVYRELDNVREKKAKIRRDDCRLQKEVEMLNKKGYESMDAYSRAVENRIFKQRKFVSRLAKIKQPKVKDEDLRASVGKGLAGDSFFDDMGMGAGLPTNSMSHVSSIQAEDSFFPYQNSYFDSDGQANSMNMMPGGLKKKPMRSVSSSILPPLPWQLQNNPEQQAEYVNNRANKNHFVKNISNRINQEYAMADRIEANQIANRMKAQANNPNDDVHWLKATGQAAWEQHHSKSAGSLRRQAEVEKKAKPKPKTNFDPDRLLHPWQRSISQKRREYSEQAIGIRQKAEQQVEQALNRGQEQEQGQGQGQGQGQKKEHKSNYFHRDDDDDESDSDDGYDQYGQPRRELGGAGSPVKLPMKSKSGGGGVLPPIHPSKKSVTKQLVARIKADTGGGGSPVPKSPAASALVAHISETQARSQGQAQPIVQHIMAESGDHGDNDEDDEDDNDEGIGWSPFAVTLE